MANGKNTIVIYKDWESTFSNLTDEEAGKLIKHLFAYVNDKEPKSDRLIELVFEPLKQTLKRDLKHWESVKERRIDAGRKGGLKSGEVRKQNEANEANASNLKQNEANEAVIDSVIVSVSVIDSDIEEIYNSYPSKCVTKGSSTGKTKKDKDKIKSILKLNKETKESLISKINQYVDECRKFNRYTKNFGTFLNNIPDTEVVENKTIQTEFKDPKNAKTIEELSQFCKYMCFGSSKKATVAAFKNDLHCYGEEQVKFICYAERD